MNSYFIALGYTFVRIYDNLTPRSLMGRLENCIYGKINVLLMQNSVLIKAYIKLCDYCASALINLWPNIFAPRQ